MKTFTQKYFTCFLALSAASWASANDTPLPFSGINNDNIEKALTTPSSEVEYNTAIELREMIQNSAMASQESINAARSVCYSSLAGNNNHSMIMVPLPSSSSDLDELCKMSINSGWFAGGVAKSNHYTQNCGSLDNTQYGGGYTSYVTEAYFEANRNNYLNCGPTNAMVCCSPQHPD